MKKIVIKIISVLFIITMCIQNSSYVFAEMEDGRDYMDSYKKQAEFQLQTPNELQSYAKASFDSEKSILIPANTRLEATERDGYWFLVKTVDGPKWIYQKTEGTGQIELREIENVSTSNMQIKLNGQTNLFEYPFDVYPTKNQLESGIYKILKKSGDWYYTESGDYKGWFILKSPSLLKNGSAGPNETSGTFVSGIANLGMSNIQSIPLHQSIVPISDNVRPGIPQQPLYITIHNTDNTDVGANAKQHAEYLQNEAHGGSRYASWHYTVDDKEIYQHIPLNEVAWHAGDRDGPGNRSSVAIEIAENSDGNYAQAENNAAKLTAQLLKSLNLPIEAVVPHQKWSGKNCPSRILGRPNGWNSFINNVQIEYSKISSDLGIMYQSHVQDIGWQDWKYNGTVSGTEGKAKRVEALNIKFNQTIPGMSIKYRAHVQNIGWQDWVKDGKLSGTVGQSKRLEAIQISAQGLPSGSRIEYRTHVQDVGWGTWQQDGKISGTIGQAKRLEAIEIRIVTDALSPGATYQSYIQEYKWQNKVTDGGVSGTQSIGRRIEAIKIQAYEPGATNLGIKYQTHIQDTGWLPWQSNGSVSGTPGSGKRMEAIRISLENAPPGYYVRYRTHIQDIGWTEWKRDGETSGTEGKGKRLEAIQIEIKKE